MLQCRGLVLDYPGPRGELRALDGVDLDMARGEFVSLVGPSGCGKSTLFNILAGLERPGAGTACLDGQSLIGQPGLVSYMPQRDCLLPWLTVLDNTALPLELGGSDRAGARGRAAQLFARFGLEGFESRWPRELSGGMRQRAALLRTYLIGRDLMLLDEPFGALDALTRTTMQEWLLEVWTGTGRAVLFTTHDVEEALFLADRVLVMSPRPGRIIAEIVVPFRRPRDFHLVGDSQFAAAKERLLGILRGGTASAAA